MTAQKILEIARGELGTVEFPPKSNCVKYNDVYYGRKVIWGNYAWCAVFVWWVFREAGASSLYYGGGKTAYCPTLMQFHKAQSVKSDYQPGDIIFFNFNGGKNAAHVGICEGTGMGLITTIDGNTGTGSEANGGAVMRRTRALKYVVGAYRPAYEEVLDLTEEQVRKIVKDELLKQEQERAMLHASEWAVLGGYNEAVKKGITDGTRPQSYATRQEVALMVNKAK